MNSRLKTNGNSSPKAAKNSELKTLLAFAKLW